MSKIYQKEYVRRKKQSKARFCLGFTLIELLVVVLIIGILAAIALPKYEKAVKKARVVKVLPIIKSLQDAQKLYYLSNGKYASCLNDLDFDLSSFSIKAESDGCITSVSKGTGADAITVHRVGNGTWAAYIGSYMVSGFGGYGFNPATNIPLSCAEYACHAVEQGSFCHDVMGTSQTPILNSWCVRLFALP